MEQVTAPVDTGGRRRREGDQLRDELLAAATSLTAAPRPVSIPALRAVARACGVSATAVYRHFPSQRALTEAVLSAVYEQFQRTVLAGDDPGGDAGVRLRRLTHAFIAWGVANPGLYQLLFESADQLDEYESALVSSSDDLLRRVHLLLAAQSEPAADAPAHDVELLAERLLNGVHGLVSLRIHKPTHHWVIDPAAEVDHLLGSLR